MRLWRIIAVATAAELSFASALFAVLGVVGGAFSEWLDLINNFTVLGLVASLVALSLTLLVTPKGGARRTMIGAALVGVLGAAILLGPETVIALKAQAARPAPGAKTFKLVQFNVWHENNRMAVAGRTIAAAAPDVLAVEEIDGFTKARLDPIGRQFPYRSTCTPDWGCGLILYSKLKPLKVEDLTPPGTDEPTALGLLKVTFQAPDGKPVTVFAVHMSWPMPPGAQRRQWRRLADAVKAAGPTRVMVVGDFNLTPWSYGLRRGDAMLAPLTRRTHGAATYPATVPRARLPWPAPFMAIDQIYASPDLTVTGVHALPNAASDHRPVEATVGG